MSTEETIKSTKSTRTRTEKIIEVKDTATGNVAYFRAFTKAQAVNDTVGAMVVELKKRFEPREIGYAEGMKLGLTADQVIDLTKVPEAPAAPAAE